MRGVCTLGPRDRIAELMLESSAREICIVLSTVNKRYFDLLHIFVFFMITSIMVCVV